MKKTLFTIAILFAGVGLLPAKPVDINRAQRLGQAFLEQKQAKTAVTLELAYVQQSEDGVVTAYVFNAQDGFVILSADDCYRPILGYSEQGKFDYSTAPDGMLFMLGELSNDIARCISQHVAVTSRVSSEWKNLEATGRLNPTRNLPAVDMLVKQRWDQGAPYNMYVPAGCPTGCVATAMAQLMKYWEWPVTGTGSHSYDWMGQTLSADFGATTYEWDQMLDSYTMGAVTPENKVAVATLMYHCGISVDMMYEPDGSGAFSTDVPGAISNYFSYSAHSTHIARSGTYDDWIALLKSNIDQHIPIYYSGQSPDGGHAFICDGYDTDGLFHFNWGWGGAGDNYFLIDGDHFDYSGNQAIVYDFIPDYVYDEMPQEVTGLSVSIDSDVSRIGHLTWVNPTTTMSGEPLSAVDKVIVKRNDLVVHEIEGVAPGQTLTYDDEVPYFDQFEYTILVLTNGNYGRTAKTKAVFGPYCDWKVIMTSTSFQGWDGGGITVQNAAGTYIDFLTTTQATASIQNFQMALGNNNLYWVAPNSNISNLSFKIKDSQNQLIYEYEGPSSGLEAGLLRTLNNSCGETNTCESPYNLVATVDPDNVENVILSWESNHEPEFGYCIYRDGLLFNMAHTTQYVDEHTNIGGHCYYVTALCMGGETDKSNDYCITSGTGCNDPRDLYYGYATNNKVQLNWSAPEGTWPTGYIVYRKTDQMATYKEIKRLKQTTLKDTSSQQGTAYQYAVVAYYDTIDCTSTYANDLLNPLQYCVRVDWSNTPCDLRAVWTEDGETNGVSLRWHPAFMATSYSIMRNGTEIGEVDEATFTDEQVAVGETYCYIVVAHGEGFDERTNEECITIPNPDTPVLPCPVPTDLRHGSQKASIEWTAPVDRTPDSYTVVIIDHILNEEITEITGVTETVYVDMLPSDDYVIDRSYQVKAVYGECESEWALTDDGDNFIRINNTSIGERTPDVILYPNPTSSRLSIVAEGMNSVDVYDLVGQCLMQLTTEDGQAVVDMSQWQNGVYLVKVNLGNGSLLRRVVKM